jgi:hypothetical protein
MMPPMSDAKRLSMTSGTIGVISIIETITITMPAGPEARG